MPGSSGPAPFIIYDAAMRDSNIRSRNKMTSTGRALLLMLLLINTGLLEAQVITVKQDGTGDYTSIQAAINASQTGDTVLVWPGTYFENINFNGHSIVLGSLNLTTGDPAYINQTIIDGNHIESCLKVISGETVEITGFKITHGNGDTEFLERGDGGGLFTWSSSVSVKNCLITENNAWGAGGGIYNGVTDLYLSGTTISYNHAKERGGGLEAANHEYQLLFDTINRCNIYLNFAGIGCDIYTSQSSIPFEVIVDTFTVLLPDRYHIETNYNTVPDTNFILEALHAKIEASDHDLFVSPSGDNSNSGISPDQPLKTLSFALTKIITNDSINRKIFLSNGLYSDSASGEKFPINIRGYLDIIGENEDSTIFDGDSLTHFFDGNEEIKNYTIKNLTLRNGTAFELFNPAGAILLVRNWNAKLENITIRNASGVFSGSIHLPSCNNLTLNNVKCLDGIGGFGTIRTGNGQTSYVPFIYDTINLINCRIQNSKPSPYGYWEGPGGGLEADGQESKDSTMLINVINCEITNNLCNTIYPSWAVSALHFSGGVTVNLINSTIGNNGSLPGQNSCGIGFYTNSYLNIYNSVIYGNGSPQIIFGRTGSSEDPCGLTVYNSLIEGGQEGILNVNPANSYYYDLSNINADPIWDTASMYPYSLSEFSPCIDAGTLELPPGIELPEYDLAGNPRMWGESVDMGAYEYGPWVGVKEVGSRRSAVGSQMNVNPNPFKYGTYISYELLSSGKLNISVYSISGLKVRMLENHLASKGDSGKFYWDGSDDARNKLPSGVYFIRLTMDGKEVETVKIVV